MTGFEFPQTHRTINKIQHFRVQMAARSSKEDANLQPIATRILTIKNSWLTKNPTRRSNDEPALAASLPPDEHP